MNTKKQAKNLYNNAYSIIQYLAKAEKFLDYEHDAKRDYWQSVVRNGTRGREISFENFALYVFQQNVIQLQQMPSAYVNRAFLDYRKKYGNNENLDKIRGLVFYL